jgi:hypothetical protein
MRIQLFAALGIASVTSWLGPMGGCSNSSPSKVTSTDAAAPGDGASSSEAGADALADGPSDAPADGQPTKAWDWVGVVGTGQSLSVGQFGTPEVATKQPFHNLALSLGTAKMPPFDPTSSALGMIPLREPLRQLAVTYPSAYPLNLYGETPHTAMGSQITTLFQGMNPGGDYVTVHTVVGENGQPMSVINKTAMEVDDDAGTSMGRAYAATLFEASAITRLATMAGKTYGVGAIVITHGESDAGNPAYENDMHKLWSDYNKDISAITGQTQSIPMLVSQQHSVPMGMGQTSASTLAQWKVGVDYPNNIICAGPKYQYPYYSDGVHLVTQGYELLGEKFGEIFFARVVLGQSWQPLQPTAASRSGAMVTVQFHVPVEPLAWDDTLPSPHPTGYPQWTMGRGFEVSLNGTPVNITAVAIANDAVQITSDTDLSTGSVSVAYAYTADGAIMTGGTSRWGHLKDSDAMVGATTKIAQPNYCVSFTMAVP